MSKDKSFKYEGESTDVWGIPSYVYIGEKWSIFVWFDSTGKSSNYTLQGTVENMNGKAFEFILYLSGRLTYRRILESNYNGLGIQYDENDKIVPKYVVSAIRKIEGSYNKMK
jgi:hypothetical protein